MLAGGTSAASSRSQEGHVKPYHATLPTSLALVLLSLIWSPLARAGEGHLPSPSGLSAEARRVVHQRMEQHGKAMSQLVWAVILLQYDQAARAASAIADGARPLDRNDPALAELVYLFEQQDRLREQARAIADAAAKRDGIAMGAGFKQLSETCVDCHVAYLKSADKK
jgi:hypothetical protein